MKQSNVYLCSRAQEGTNNQDSFVINQYLDHLTEQTETNLHLTASFSGLLESCQTILDNIQKQEANFNAQKHKERHHHLQLKSISRKISLATQNHQDSLDNQESSIQKIMDQLTKQAEAISKLRNSSIHQKAYFNKLVINQNNYFEHIMKRLEDQDIHQKTRFEKITMQQVRLQHQVGKQELALSDVKDLLRKLQEAKGSIHKLLSSLPTNYPMKKLVVSGKTIPIKNFIMANENTGVAIFSNDTESIYVAIDKIEAIYWK